MLWVARTPEVLPFISTRSIILNLIRSNRGARFPAFGTIIQGDSLLAVFENKYEDSIVFKEWDSMIVKGNAYTDRVLPGLDYIISMSLTECGPFLQQRIVAKE